MSRSVPEWIGATPNTPVPDRVRVRVFERYEGRCHACTRKIAAGESWVCDHFKALINGGENRERNLKPLCDWCDRNVKTPADVAEKSRTYKRKKRHLGLRRAKSPMRGWRRFDGSLVINPKAQRR